MCLAPLKMYLNNNVDNQFCLRYDLSHWQKKKYIVQGCCEAALVNDSNSIFKMKMDLNIKNIFY